LRAEKQSQARQQKNLISEKGKKGKLKVNEGDMADPFKSGVGVRSGRKWGRGEDARDVKKGKKKPNLKGRD